MKIWHDGHVPENSELEVIVRGIIEQDEAMFTKALEKIAQNARVKREFKDIRTVLQHPLYQRFHKKLKSQVEESKIDRVNEVVLEVMSTLIAGGDFED